MSDLILVPTVMERDLLLPRLSGDALRKDYALQLCGFGPIAAAARAASLIARYRPQRVLLIGIAGSYEVDQIAIGSAVRFDQVACYGVGVGSGGRFIPASEMGWQQFTCDEAQPHVGDLITLESAYVPRIRSAGLLLTCCAASSCADEVQQRRSTFPKAIAEDMEGFGVAMACALARIPLQIVRGISNQAGNREHRSWQVESALAAAADLALKLMPRVWLPAS